MRSDILLEAELDEFHFLIHIEWQSDKDEEMDVRLHGYAYEGNRLHKLPVLSAVIYLQAVSDVPQSPVEWFIPTRGQMLSFKFDNLELHETLVEDLRKHHLDALFVLMLLCKDGATYDVLEEILERLEKHNRKELVSITRFFAGTVFTSRADRERLEGRFTMLRDFFEGSWTFQETLKEGRVEGRVEEAHQNIEALAQARFPDLLAFVKERIATLSDLSKLQEILILVGTARTQEEIRRPLMALQ